MGVTLLTPTAEPGVRPTAYTLWIDLREFEGVMGFFANSQPGSREFLKILAAEVMPRLGAGAGAHFEDKGLTPIRSAVVMSEDELDKAAETCDAAILAYGHCGGCTSSTIRDAVGIARRGTPVVALVAPYFEAEARQISRAVGMPDLPIYVLPGPMVRKNDEERTEVARAVGDGILAMLEAVR